MDWVNEQSIPKCWLEEDHLVDSDVDEKQDDKMWT
jgi:hypothetical protein